jgi:hypothetical protein
MFLCPKTGYIVQAHADLVAPWLAPAAPSPARGPLSSVQYSGGPATPEAWRHWPRSAVPRLPNTILDRGHGKPPQAIDATKSV